MTGAGVLESGRQPAASPARDRPRRGKTRRAPFEFDPAPDERRALAVDLAQALEDALSARTITDAEIEYFHTLYEQGRTRGSRGPWQDAADLTSYLGTQYVDVLRSQIVQTVMTEPVYTVEGYGEAATRAPFVEEFHQWQLEAEGFQQVFARAVHLALIEPSGTIEVYEDTIKRPVRRVIQAATQLTPEGAAIIGPDLQPVLQRSETGAYVEVTDETTPATTVEIDSWETVCRGPRERVLASRDFLRLPGHAHEKSEVWGYAKRFHRRIEELRERVAAGVYDAEAVEAIGTDDERPAETTLAGQPLAVAVKDDQRTSEKELWELLFLRDLDGTGLRWWVATLHKDRRVLLRIQHDDLGQPRFFSLIPFPRPNSIDGYSYIGHKLITMIEEHTAWRNMLADRAAFQLQAPLKKLQGALWDPDVEPIGPKSVITVRDMREIEPMQFPDATAPAIERIRDAERAGERLSGINDASAGVSSQEKRTLGEVELITQQSMGRTSEAVKNIQETLEEIAQVRHLMWKRALSELGREGLEAPPSVIQNLSIRQVAAPSTGDALVGLERRTPEVTPSSPTVRFTAQMLEGTYRFKPRGSVENADRGRQRYDFNQWLLAMASMAKVNPMVAIILQTPAAAKAMIEQGVRLYNVQDKQAFLGSEAMQAGMLGLQQQAQQATLAQAMTMRPPAGPAGGAPPLGGQMGGPLGGP